eukprot:2585316-Pyramimonas_sp.AAC.1
MAISEYPWHVGQCRAMQALTASLFPHSFVPCQGCEDVRVPSCLFFRDGLSLEDTGRWILVVHMGMPWRERHVLDSVLIGTHPSA